MLFWNKCAVCKIEECVVNEAGFEFDIDGIATISWSGIGKSITECEPPTATINEGTNLTTNMIRNRLTTLTAKSSLGATSEITYSGLVLTGGSINFSNNATFITPAEMMATYFKSDLIRILIVVLGLGFAIPFIAMQLSLAGVILLSLIHI